MLMVKRLRELNTALQAAATDERHNLPDNHLVVLPALWSTVGVDKRPAAGHVCPPWGGTGVYYRTPCWKVDPVNQGRP